MGFGNNFKKGIGNFFKPRNVFSRSARVGGTAAGAMIGGPRGASTGYDLGDKLAGTWEKDDSDKGYAENAIMRGKFMGNGGGGNPIASIGNLFSRNPPPASSGSLVRSPNGTMDITMPRGGSDGGIDLNSILQILKMYQGMKA